MTLLGMLLKRKGSLESQLGGDLLGQTREGAFS